MSADEDDLAAEMVAELRGLLDSGAGVRLEITPVEAFQLIAGLQLALRHPSMAVGGEFGTVSATLRKVAVFLEAKFQPYPATAELLRRGWIDGDESAKQVKQ